jgi:hypothetical protein
VGSSLFEGVSWSEELSKVSVLNRKSFSSVGIEMMMNPESLEAGSAVVRAYASRQGRPVLREELQEQAKRAFAGAKKKSHEGDGGD